MIRNLRDTVLAEHSRRQANKIIHWVGSDKKRFGELIKLFLKGEYRVTQRIGWPLSDIVIKQPHLITPYIKLILEKTQEPGIHDAVKRNVLRLLQDVDIPKKYLGLATIICFDFLGDSNEPIAVRVFSMSILLNIVKKEPGLKDELKALIEDLMHMESAGIRARGRKILSALEKI